MLIKIAIIASTIIALPFAATLFAIGVILNVILL